MKYILILVALFISSINIVNSKEYEGLVTKVIDGDSIFVKQNDTINKIRLSYIDAPEMKQAYGGKSKLFLKNLLMDRKVLVSTDYNDRYGRQIADIYILTDIEAIYINAKMIKSGNAWVYKKYRSNSYLINLENHARMNNKGLWREINPIEPWLYRRDHR